MRLRQDWKKERSRNVFEVVTGIAVRKETTLSRQENKQISSLSRNLHEGRKQEMMKQHEREVVTKDQIGLQQKRCRNTEFSKRKDSQVAT